CSLGWTNTDYSLLCHLAWPSDRIAQRMTFNLTFAKTNEYLPDNSQIRVSLHNGPRNLS
ncbi:hypothetical protein BGY98DRAFT_1032592, partial [Russula aff. rugulosa BPL654]